MRDAAVGVVLAAVALREEIDHRRVGAHGLGGGHVGHGVGSPRVVGVLQQGAEFGVARLCGGIDQQDRRDGNVACGGFAERGVERIELFGVEIVGFAAVGVFDHAGLCGRQVHELQRTDVDRGAGDAQVVQIARVVAGVESAQSLLRPHRYGRQVAQRGDFVGVAAVRDDAVALGRAAYDGPLRQQPVVGKSFGRGHAVERDVERTLRERCGVFLVGGLDAGDVGVGRQFVEQEAPFARIAARDADFVGGRLDAVYFARVRCVEVLFEPFLVDRCILVVLVFGRVFGTFGVGHFAQPQVAQADVGVLHRAEVDTQQVARFAPEELFAAFADAHAILLPCVGGLERRGDDRPFDVGNHFAVDFRPKEELYVVRATVGLIFEGQYVEVGGDVSVEGNGAEIGIFSGSMDAVDARRLFFDFDVVLYAGIHVRHERQRGERLGGGRRVDIGVFVFAGTPREEQQCGGERVQRAVQQASGAAGSGRESEIRFHVFLKIWK